MTPPHGIQRRPLKYLVFAGNYREFREWQRTNNIPNGEALFIAERTNLRGVHVQSDLTFVIVGTFHLRNDSKELVDYARSIWETAPEVIQ